MLKTNVQPALPHPSILALRTPRDNGRLAMTGSSLLRTPRCYGLLAITDFPLLRTPRYYGHPAITDTPLLRTLRFFLNSLLRRGLLFSFDRWDQ